VADKKDEMKDREDEETPDEETSEETPQDEETADAGSEPVDADSEDADSEPVDADSSDEDSLEEPSEEEAPSEEQEPHEPTPHTEAVEESEVASSASVASEAPLADGDLEGVAAFFEHPKHLMAAATYARDSDYEEFDAYSPFPIHGMDEAMGLGRSWIPWVTFGAGLAGFVLANLLQFGMMTFDWPMIIGGKPYAPWPSFVPIMFELTVLLAGVTTAVVMLKAAGCFQKPLIIDPSITDDRFVLWISAKDNKFDVDEVIEFLEDLRPLEVRKIVKDA
jgi:hypothetical protein